MNPTDLVLQRLAHVRMNAELVVDEKFRGQLIALLEEIRQKWLRMSVGTKSSCRQDILERLDGEMPLFGILRDLGGMTA